ncbi:hypothetical protein [Yoonia sp. 2307UL14-13]|uniref:hypothetical protein n=1 Tax=Yoonia sp. 2307UL14-13 TaxID=3126506 RepID=UPI0030AEC92B
MIGLDFSMRPGRSAPSTAPPQPLSQFFAGGGGQSVALAPGAAGNLSVWTEIGADHAALLRFDGNDTGTRWSWRETLIAELRNVYTVGDLTLSAGWSQLQSSGSGLTGSYTGNRAISTSSANAVATVTVNRAAPYDVWVHYTGRTNGGYCRVDIDGAQDLVTEIDDPAALGFKAFSMYSATDLQRRQSIKVATGLTGAHTVTLSHGGVATPGGNTILIEAVAISGALTDPKIMPQLWQPATSYTIGDEVQFGGLFYTARGTGVSGADGPTHTGGIASDGALDWRADNRSTYPRFVTIDYASEREYAARVSVGGAATEIGGQTHGNEPLQHRTVLLDGAPWVPNDTGNGLSVGTECTITEETEWRTGTGAALTDCALTRTITPGAISHGVSVTGTGAVADFDWFYAGMLPLVAWDGEMRSDVIETVSIAGYSDVILADYDGANPPNLDFAGAQRIGLTGAVLDATLLYGHEAAATPVPGNIVNQFDTFLRPNLNATTSGGSSDWQAKAYVTGDAAGGLRLGAGDRLAFFNRHVLRVDPQAT